MKKFDLVSLKIFAAGILLLASLAVVFGFYGWDRIQNSGSYVLLIYNLYGAMIACWMLLTIFLSIRLIVSAPFRNAVLAKIMFFQERDEREVMLTAKAGKVSFLISLAILFLLLWLSCFQISVYRVAPEKAVNGKTGIVHLGVKCDLFAKQMACLETKQKDIFSYNTLPISSTALILLLITCHIVSYNVCMRRLTK